VHVLSAEVNGLANHLQLLRCNQFEKASAGRVGFGHRRSGTPTVTRRSVQGKSGGGIMDDNTPGNQLSEEPQSERGEMGSRDTGSDQASGGPAERPEGAIQGHEEVPSHGGSAEEQSGGAGNLPPQHTEPAVPPYEGRQTEAKPSGESGVEGGVKPMESSAGKAPAPESTPGGATASPAHEQPAGEQSETDLDDDRVGPAHTAGTARGEARS
jgi:hypothetical protein